MIAENSRSLIKLLKFETVCQMLMLIDVDVNSVDLLFGSKLLFGRILDLLSGRYGGVHAFGYYSAESKPIWIKPGAL